MTERSMSAIVARPRSAIAVPSFSRVEIAAVIRDDHSGGAMFDGEPRVVGIENPFQKQRKFCNRPKPIDPR
ncbi:MAG TPA: hypothetical protein VGK31_02445 [Thermoanaerobaculia bacterium]|jgi:hypothetical protein